MSRDRFYIFLVLGLVLILFSFIQRNRVKAEYIRDKKALLSFNKEAKELVELRAKEGDKKRQQHFLDSLMKIKNPSKDHSTSNSRVLEFDDLELRSLNQIIKKVQNSTLNIVKFDISRVDDGKAKVRLEIKK